ncbi:EF-hand domain-containing protein [uncultured Pseudodesulfovibrio sp.]|uniref:EF-hand domain-containing protein n=1 Tax=uncultured Pseudodesulfovibrio sp. TaxID=2035858 RepID=UPI0029C96858|nr:EF-hand domain-containing protein [uncultured Pseudodesulfovibrio sp.]
MDIQSVSSMSGMMGMQGGMMRPPEKPDAEEMASDFLDAMDSDGDGQLSQSEFAVGDGETIDTEAFDALDTNQDGFVSQEELEADAQSKIDTMASQLQSGSLFSGIEQTGDSEQFQQLLDMMGSSSTDQASGAQAYGQMQGGGYDTSAYGSVLSMSA